MLALALDAAGIACVFHFIDPASTTSFLGATAAWVGRIVAGLLVLVSAPVLAFFAASVIFPLFAESVFLAAVDAISPERASALRASDGLSVAASTAVTIRQVLHFLGWSVVAFALALVPLVGPPLALATQTINTARALSWELLDPYFDKMQLDYRAQREVVREHRALLLGFGLPNVALLAIPVVGPLFFGLAQASAAVLVLEGLDGSVALTRPA